LGSPPRAGGPATVSRRSQEGMFLATRPGFGVAPFGLARDFARRAPQEPPRLALRGRASRAFKLRGLSTTYKLHSGGAVFELLKGTLPPDQSPDIKKAC